MLHLAVISCPVCLYTVVVVVVVIITKVNIRFKFCCLITARQAATIKLIIACFVNIPPHSPGCNNCCSQKGARDWLTASHKSSLIG